MGRILVGLRFHDNCWVSGASLIRVLSGGQTGWVGYVEMVFFRAVPGLLIGSKLTTRKKDNDA